MSTTEKYKIIITSIDDKVELEFRTKKLAIEKIVQLKLIDKGFIKGILEEKINGKWVIKWCLK